jgi:O-antigen ligase
MESTQSTAVRPGFPGVLKSVDAWGWYAFLVGLAVQTSTAATSVLAVLAVVWMFMHPRDAIAAWSAAEARWPIRALVALILAVLLGVPVALGLGYTPWPMLVKHLPLLFFFGFFALLQSPVRRSMVMAGFIVGALLALATSLASAVHGVPWMNGSPGDFNTFRRHAEHNIFVGLGAFLLVVSLLERPNLDKRWQWAGWLVFWLACFDILYLVQGRTGQIVLIPLWLWIVASQLRRRQPLLAAISVAVVIASIFPGLGGHKSATQSGIEMAGQDIATYQEGRAKTSVAYRLDFVKTTWAMIRERPVLGYGTGGFIPGYRDYVRLHDPEQATTDNPHTDYLFYWAEAGLPGLVAVLALYAGTLALAWRTGGLRGIALAALAVSWAVASLAYSMLLDQPTRYAFLALLAALASGPLPFGERRPQDTGQTGSVVTRLRSP